MSDWHPISTAPQDGSRVLLCRYAPGCKQGKHGFMAVDFWRSDARKYGFTGWGKFNGRSWPATHWQPLPPLPEPTP